MLYKRMEQSDSTWQGRLGLWVLYGLGIPISPIILAGVFTLQQGGTLDAGKLIGKGELDLAAVGVYASVFATLSSTGGKGEFRRLMLAVTIFLVILTASTFANVVTAISTGAGVSTSAVVYFSGAWLLGAIVLGVYGSTAVEEAGT
jgi:hypothetical protein